MFKVFPMAKNKNETSKRYWSRFGETKKRTLARYNSYFQIAFLIECEKSCFLGGLF